MLRIGDSIRHYRIVDVIGRGETAVAYKADDQQRQAVVAIKVIDWGAMDDPPDIGRMRRNAAAVQALEHPHICRVEALFVQDEMLCIVSEFVDGTSLDVEIGGRPLPLDKTVVCARQIASAFEAAHARAILHQDFKPSKVMSTSAGVKILDFGVGWIIKKARSAPVTALRVLNGEIVFASPEELRAEPKDARSDLFSFGAVLYEMATGVPPFNAPTLRAATERILNGVLAPPRAVNAAMPEALEAIILKALEFHRSRRYQDAAEMRAALDAW